MLRQRRIDGVSASTSESSVALVVLKPLIASKVDSNRLGKILLSETALRPAPW